MRRLILALALMVAGCGPEFAVLPRGGQVQIQAQAPMGITMTALAEQWHGDPYDLADWVTPILVELSNQGPNEVRVSLADFALRDDKTTRYPAINPFIPAVLGEVDPTNTKFMLASRGGGGGFSGGVGFRGGSAGGHYGGGGGYVRSYSGGMRGGVVVGPPRASRYGYGGSYWGGGFYISPGLRGFYGPGYLYWDYPFLRPPWYWAWVFWWGPSYYPTRPSWEVLQSALPEGVLPPGSKIAGYHGGSARPRGPGRSLPR